MEESLTGRSYEKFQKIFLQMTKKILDFDGVTFLFSSMSGDFSTSEIQKSE